MESSPSTSTLASSQSNLSSSPRSELCVQAQSSFFNNLMQNGYPLELLVKTTWKPFFFKFSATSCAIESRKPNGTMLAFITLRRFTISPSKTDPLQFSIKTPNKIYQLRARDTPTRTLWLNWLQSISKETSVMAEHAKLLSGNKVLTAADNDRPEFWVPHAEGDFCAACHKAFSLSARKRTCRDCGFLYCHSISCFTDGNIKRCNQCVVKHKAVGQDGKPLITSAATPTLTEVTTSQQRVYFQEDAEDQQVLEKLRQRSGFRASDLSTATQAVVPSSPSKPSQATSETPLPPTTATPAPPHSPSVTQKPIVSPSPAPSNVSKAIPPPQTPTTHTTPINDLRAAQLDHLRKESQLSDYAFYLGIALVVVYIAYTIFAPSSSSSPSSL